MTIVNDSQTHSVEIQFVDFFTSVTSLDCTDLYAHGEEYVLGNCSQQREILLLLLCTARFSVHNLLYVMLSRLIFFFRAKEN